MELLEIIAGLEVAARQSLDAARFDLAGVSALMPEYLKLTEMPDGLTAENHARMLELYPLTVAASQDVERNQRNGQLFQEAADRLRKFL